MYTIRRAASKIKTWLGFGDKAIYKGYYGDKGWDIITEVQKDLRMIGEECMKTGQFGILSDIESLIGYIEGKIAVDCYIKEIKDE